MGLLRSLHTIKKFNPHYKSHPTFEFLNAVSAPLREFNGIIAGGSVRDLFANRNPKDIDIFFDSRALSTQFSDYLRNHLSAEEAPNMDDTIDYPVRDYKLPLHGKSLKLQICIFSPPSDLNSALGLTKPDPFNIVNVLNNFDYTVSQFALIPEGWFSGPQSLDDLQNHNLNFHQIRTLFNPAFFIERFSRYCYYGYRPNPHTLSLYQKALESHFLHIPDTTLLNFNSFSRQNFLKTVEGPIEVDPSCVNLTAF